MEEPRGLQAPAVMRYSVSLQLEQKSSTSKADGDQDPEDGGSTENFRSHDSGQSIDVDYLNPSPPRTRQSCNSSVSDASVLT